MFDVITDFKERDSNYAQCRDYPYYSHDYGHLYIKLREKTCKQQNLGEPIKKIKGQQTNYLIRRPAHFDFLVPDWDVSAIVSQATCMGKQPINHMS